MADLDPRQQIDSHLPCPRQDGVLQVRACIGADFGVEPNPTRIAALTEHRNPQAVGSQFAIQNIDIYLETLASGLRRTVPVREDDAAEGVGVRQRHEGNRIECRAPQERIHAHSQSRTRAAARAGLFVQPEPFIEQPLVRSGALALDTFHLSRPASQNFVFSEDGAPNAKCRYADNC